jgi:hypothetical protein
MAAILPVEIPALVLEVARQIKLETLKDAFVVPIRRQQIESVKYTQTINDG